MPPRVLLTATGFAAKEALALLRKHNIATAPLLLRAGLWEHGLETTTDEGNGLLGACRLSDSASSLSMRPRRWTTARSASPRRAD